MRLQLLGDLATAADHARVAEMKLNYERSKAAAGDNGRILLYEREVEALKRLAFHQAEQAKLQQQLQVGIFDRARQTANAQLEIRMLIDKGVITNAEQYAAAQATIAKRIELSGEQAAIARSKFEGLTKYALDGLNTAKQFDSGALSVLNSIEGGLASFASGTKSAKDAFADMARSILADLQRILIRMALARAVSSIFSGFGGFGGPSISGNFLGTLSPVPLRHTGHGPGDPDRMLRNVSPLVFVGAPKFHSGVGPGERAAIIRDDESVLTPGQMKALGGMARGGGPTVNVISNNEFHGADPGSEARIKAYIDQKDRETEARAVQEVQRLYANQPSARPR